MKVKLYDLDPQDLEEFRRLYARREAGIMYNVPMSLEKATSIEVEMIEFQQMLFDKYLAVEDLDDRDWHVDEVTGEIYLWE